MSVTPFPRSGTRSRRRFRVLALFAVVALLLLCFLPAELKVALHTRGRLHSTGHFVIFLGLAYVLNRTSRSGRVRVMLFATTLLLGLGTEFGEHLVYGTDLEWRDVGADALGSLVGVALARFSSRRSAERSERT